MTNRGPSVMLGGVQWGEGRYPTLWVWEDGEYWAFSLHRCSAYAHGLIDHIRFEDEGVICIDGESGEARMDPDHREVHHIDEDFWNSDPENLEALEPEDHGYITNGNASS